MQVFKISKYNHWLIVLLATGYLLSSCTKEKKIDRELIYNPVYEIDTVNLYGSNVEKTKQKSSTQYLSILYGNLFKKTISGNQLTDLSEFILSVGDKQLANDIITNAAIKAPGLIIPTDAEMRANIDKFITDTYVRFYLRKPTELEKATLKNMISKDSGLKPELIYFSFALSNEYLFY